MSNCNCIEKIVAAMKEVAAEWKRPELTDLATRIEVRAIKSAARRALEQAAEPGVEKAVVAQSGSKYTFIEPIKCPDCGRPTDNYPITTCSRCKNKPAPASTPAFDATAWAEKMVDCYPATPSTISIGSLDRTVGASLFLPDFKKEVILATVKDWRNYIAAALQAAYAAGDAAGYERGKAEIDRLRSGLENFAVDPHPYISRRARAILDAAPDAKEAGR